MAYYRRCILNHNFIASITANIQNNMIVITVLSLAEYEKEPIIYATYHCTAVVYSQTVFQVGTIHIVNVE